ncbi:GNAT family N-acetyltransferase [Sulfitobacter sp. HNIBRBA2951]|uniref:GNAT family N-acetyltransferase n=1 Tax=Sulfitobacter aquimarinus TaxID=3158557 RepID=UPI0032DF405B
MSRRVTFYWKCPKYLEYKQLWCFTDWPLITEKAYNRYVAIEGSVLTARDDSSRLVGFSRVVSDWCQYAYIQDVIVEPNYRREGIATEMLSMMIEKVKIKDIHFLALFSTFEGEELYRKIGFETPTENVPLLLIGDPLPKS